MIAAPSRAGWSKWVPPAMNLSLAMPAAETTRALASIWALSVKTIPERFSMMTRPLALIRPAICEGSAALTRLSTVAPALGWLKMTDWARPTSKLVQSITARGEDWVIWVVVVVARISACPAVTLPPWGRAPGAGSANASGASSAHSKAVSAVPTSRRRRR